MAKPRRILIAMDAFGTLFSPKPSVAQQYVTVAAQHGLRGLEVDTISKSFHAAFKKVSKEYPNYGKAAGIKLEKWWREVICSTFEPHISRGQLPVLDEMVPILTNRFWCSEGYALHADARHLVQQIKARQDASYKDESIVLGVMSNSDTRIPEILKSLGYRVAKLRTDTEVGAKLELPSHVDFQFVVHSYDVGHEKPAKEIFDATEALARRAFWPDSADGQQLLKLYVGDERVKDGQAAQESGWHAVVVDRDNSSRSQLGSLDGLLEDLRLIVAHDKPQVIEVSGLSPRGA